MVLTNALGTSVSGTSATGFGFSQVHDVQLTGLELATKYYYKAVTGSVESAIYFFKRLR